MVNGLVDPLPLASFVIIVQQKIQLPFTGARYVAKGDANSHNLRCRAENRTQPLPHGIERIQTCLVIMYYRQLGCVRVDTILAT